MLVKIKLDEIPKEWTYKVYITKLIGEGMPSTSVLECPKGPIVIEVPLGATLFVRLVRLLDTGEEIVIQDRGLQIKQPCSDHIRLEISEGANNVH